MRATLAILMTCSIIGLWPAAAAAGWTGAGVPVTGTAFPKVAGTAVSDGAGGAIVAWLEIHGASTDVYATRLDGNGDRVAGWAAGGTALCTTDSNEVQVQLVRDGAGGAFAVFLQVGLSGISYVFAQHVNASGAIVSGWPANGLPIATDVQGAGAADTNDGFLLMGWADNAGQIYLRRLTAAGGSAPGWSSPLAVGSGAGGEVSVDTDGAGGAYLAWYEGTSVLVTRIAAGGGAASGWTTTGLLVLDTTPTGASLNVVHLSSGDAFVSWDDIRSTTDSDIYAMRVNAGGTLDAGWPAGGVAVKAGTGDQTRPYGVSDGAGGAIVVWTDDLASLAAQRITASGAVATGWPAAGRTLCSGTSAKNIGLNVISDDAGGAIAAWSEYVSDDDIFAQRVAADGTIPSGWPAEGQLLTSAPYSQTDPLLVRDGAGGAIVFWQGQDALSVPQVYGGRVLVGGTVPALASLVEARAEDGIVRLSWFSPDGPSFAADLERAVNGAEFAVIARVQGDGLGHVAYEDRDVVAGSTYRYRLAVSEAGSRRTFGETSVTVGVAARLAIAGFRPNPAAGEARVAFTLASKEPARLEVLDVSGRRVATREVSGAPGEHVAALGGTRLAPGVYVVRLTQGGQTATARAVVAR